MNNQVPTLPGPSTTSSTTGLPTNPPLGATTALGAAGGLILVTLVALLGHYLWRLPEILERRGNARVIQLGGAHTVQNRGLHVLIYLILAYGVLRGQVTGAMMVAGILGIYTNTRRQGSVQA